MYNSRHYLGRMGVEWEVSGPLRHRLDGPDLVVELPEGTQLRITPLRRRGSWWFKVEPAPFLSSNEVGMAAAAIGDYLLYVLDNCLELYLAGRADEEEPLLEACVRRVKAAAQPEAAQQA